MNTGNSEIDNVVKIIESVAPDGYGRMPIPSPTDYELFEQIQVVLQSDSVSDYLLNQRGIDGLFKFMERMCSQCLRESDFLYCEHAAQALEVVLSQPDFDEKMIQVALALIHDSYERLEDPRPKFDSKLLPRFNEAWAKFITLESQDKNSSDIKYRISTEPDGPRYICYW